MYERDVAGPDVLDDPVIRHVEPAPNDNELDERVRRRPERSVGDDVDLDLVPTGNLVDLLLDRAAVSVEQRSPSAGPRCGHRVGGPSPCYLTKKGSRLSP